MSPKLGTSARTAANRLLDRIESRKAKLGVIGLGYVGLPLAVEFGHAGYRVYGFDIDARRVSELTKGKSYIQDVPSTDIRSLVQTGRLMPTTNFQVLRELDAVNVCVPTPLSKQKDPDVSYIVAAAREVARYLHPGML